MRRYLAALRRLPRRILRRFSRSLPSPGNERAIALEAQVAELSRYIPINRLTLLLSHFSFDGVIDGGAHRGQWSASVVPHLQAVKRPTVFCIDPLFEPSDTAREQIEAVGDLRVIRAALGAERGRQTFHKASNDGQSSSFLSFAPAHTDAAPSIHFSSEVEVNVMPLDDLIEMGAKGTLLLKLDLQGYELQALSGARELLSSVTAIVVEASLQETYVTGSTLIQLAAELGPKGFVLAGLHESFSFPNWGAMVQVDAVFIREHLFDLMRTSDPS